ncbi:MAG: agmatinase [Bacillota bacterium]|nr:agmatinase [Bacillota bacterium]
MSSLLPLTENTGIFMASGSELEKAKGVILGAPLDDTSSFRSGSRFAPSSVRTVSRALEEHSIYLAKDLRDISFYDAGDLVFPAGGISSSLEIISTGVSRCLEMGKKPFLIGGEHTVTYGAVKGCLDFYKEITVIFIDAHADLRPTYQGIEHSHAAVAYLLQQLKGITLYQFGVRSADKEEMSILAKGNASLFSVLKPLKTLLPRLKNSFLYITLDIDVVDPAFAPGVSAPEPGGIFSGEVLEIFSLFQDYKEQIIGFDLVEICPPYDHSQITAILGAKIMREALLSLL